MRGCEIGGENLHKPEEPDNMLGAFTRGADRVAAVKDACQAAGVVMGNELAKRYAIEPDATGSGGHGYGWKSYAATRKKDGLEVSVFVFDKSALEKKLRGQGRDLVRQIVDVMRRDVEVMAEYSGVDPKALEKARAPGASGGASLRDAMMSGVTGVAVATATKRAPLGCLQLIETLESRTAAVFVGERVACSLGTGQEKRAKFPTSKAPISAVFHSFRLIFGRAIISRNGLEAWALITERARVEHSR